MGEELTERQKKVLLSVIQDYILMAEPVGSRNVAKRYMGNVSPATIRNEMADLEEMGYLYQPYTSAGRVPTDKAYRFYVDYLLKNELFREVEGGLLREEIKKQQIEIDTLLQRVARLLSDSTDYLGLVLSPLMREVVLEKVRLVPLDSKHVLLVIVSKRSGIMSKVIEFVDGFDVSDLDEVEAFLNRHLADRSVEYVSEFKKHLLYLMDEKLRSYVSLFSAAAEAIDSMEMGSVDEKLYWMGMSNILKLPEFRNVEKIKLILRVLEEEDRLEDILLEDVKKEGIKVRIGEENIIDEIKECTLITDNYYINGRLVGVIGILGPTRMNYRKVIGLIDEIARELSDVKGE